MLLPQTPCLDDEHGVLLFSLSEQPVRYEQVSNTPTLIAIPAGYQYNKK